jgi:dipeptide transport system ATP-binding protein
LNLLKDIQQEMTLAFLFIAHDLSVVRYLADDVMVMYLGRVAEYGESEQIFRHPRHPYTQALLASTPHLKAENRKERVILSGELPSPLSPPSGCVFHTRCPYANERCTAEIPALLNLDDTLQVACHGVEEGRL